MEATRDTVEYRYDLIPPQALAALAKRLAQGAAKYGDNNWKKGAPGHKSPINHALGHLTKYLDEKAAIQRNELSDWTDDHLGAALCNIAFQIYFDSVPYYDMENRLEENVVIVAGEPMYTLEPNCMHDAALTGVNTDESEGPREIEQLPLWLEPEQSRLDFQGEQGIDITSAGMAGWGTPSPHPPRAAAGDQANVAPESKIRAALYKAFGIAS